MTAPDRSKTQFLVKEHGVALFRRKRATALFNGRHEFIRLCNVPDYWELRKNFPEETKKDGLYLETIWTLIPIEGKN